MPLPQFEADADPERRSALTVAEQAARLQKPSTIVVKYGDLGWVGEYAWEGDASPGCGSKILCKTHRGTEVGEMLTTTCENSGCGKSVSRQEMLEFIENSGGKDYPFQTWGRAIRVATVEELQNTTRFVNSGVPCSTNFRGWSNTINWNFVPSMRNPSLVASSSRSITPAKTSSISERCCQTFGRPSAPRSRCVKLGPGMRLASRPIMKSVVSTAAARTS